MGILFGLLVGLAVALYSYQWITDPEPRAARALQEQVVEVSRMWLESMLAVEGVEIVDALAPNRKVGKVYVYAEAPGWAVSGYYRRGEQDPWHPYLMTLSAELELALLKVQDPLLADRAAGDPRLEVAD